MTTHAQRPIVDWCRVPAPLAAVGDLLHVRNYRTRDNRVEEARVIKATFVLEGLSAYEDSLVGQWHYYVRLRRRGATHGAPLFLTVKDAHVVSHLFGPGATR